MNPKPRSKGNFASFVQKTNPLPATPKEKKEFQKGVRLSNGFFPGERVYFKYGNTRHWGTVLPVDTPDQVWCNFDNELEDGSLIGCGGHGWERTERIVRVDSRYNDPNS